MNRYAEMRERHRKEFGELPIGFAFDNGQYAEMLRKWGLEPGRDNGKVISIGFGGYIQRKDFQDYHSMLSRQESETREAVRGDDTGEGFIYEMFATELADHEFGCTMDADDALDAVGLKWDQVQGDSRLKRGFDKAAREILSWC